MKPIFELLYRMGESTMADIRFGDVERNAVLAQGGDVSEVRMTFDVSKHAALAAWRAILQVADSAPEGTVAFSTILNAGPFVNGLCETFSQISSKHARGEITLEV